MSGDLRTFTLRHPFHLLWLINNQWSLLIFGRSLANFPLCSDLFGGGGVTSIALSAYDACQDTDEGVGRTGKIGRNIVGEC